jgi:hypothetical protein
VLVTSFANVVAAAMGCSSSENGRCVSTDGRLTADAAAAVTRRAATKRE